MTAHAAAHERPVQKEREANNQDSLRLWLRLFTCAKLVERDVDSVLKREFASSLPRFDLLAQLFRSAGGLRMGELSELTLSTGGNVTWLVAALEGDGYVSRRVDRHDKRAVLVKLTAPGRRHFMKMAKVHEELIARRFEGLSMTERRALHALLGVVKQRVPTVVTGKAL